MDRLVQHQQTINDQLARYGVKFGLYKNGTFQERLFPFDPLPRVITAQEFETLDRGLVQRVNTIWARNPSCTMHRPICPSTKTTAAMCWTIWKRWWSRMWPKRAAMA